jgi:amino acid transporter
MQLTYTLSEAEFLEYIELVRPLRDTRRKLRLFSLFAAGISLILAYGFSPRTRLFFIFLAVFLLLFSFAVAFFSANMVKRIFRDNPILSGEKRVDFSPEKVTSDTESQHRAIKWTAFIKVGETASLLVLFMAKNMGMPIPKRVFNPEQLLEFRALLSQKVPSAYAGPTVTLKV